MSVWNSEQKVPFVKFGDYLVAYENEESLRIKVSKEASQQYIIILLKEDNYTVTYSIDVIKCICLCYQSCVFATAGVSNRFNYNCRAPENVGTIEVFYCIVLY